ncbi:hypothetical protein BH09ACT10_BH09ACT10_06140 [soil metagenome]
MAEKRVVVTWSSAANAHTLLLQEAQEFTGTHGQRLAHLCQTCGSDEHGKPHVVPNGQIHVTLSRTTGLVIVAVTDAGPVGIDIEQAGSVVVGGIDAWVRNEAVVKATGRGLTAVPVDPGIHQIYGLDLPEGYIGALALLNDEPVTITVRQATQEAATSPTTR